MSATSHAESGDDSAQSDGDLASLVRAVAADADEEIELIAERDHEFGADVANCDHFVVNMRQVLRTAVAAGGDSVVRHLYTKYGKMPTARTTKALDGALARKTGPMAKFLMSIDRGTTSDEISAVLDRALIRYCDERDLDGIEFFRNEFPATFHKHIECAAGAWIEKFALACIASDACAQRLADRYLGADGRWGEYSDQVFVAIIDERRAIDATKAALVRLYKYAYAGRRDAGRDEFERDEVFGPCFREIRDRYTAELDAVQSKIKRAARE